MLRTENRPLAQVDGHVELNNGIAYIGYVPTLSNRPDFVLFVDLRDVFQI